MSTNSIQQLGAQLSQSFELGQLEMVSQEALMAALAYRVADLMERNTDQLFSLLYRLDISEKDLKLVMQSASDVPKKIAVLIYERQLEKIISRNKYKSSSPDEDLAW
jgi:hypothetical protein